MNTEESVEIPQHYLDLVGTTKVLVVSQFKIKLILLLIVAVIVTPSCRNKKEANLHYYIKASSSDMRKVNIADSLFKKAQPGTYVIGCDTLHFFKDH